MKFITLIIAVSFSLGACSKNIKRDAALSDLPQKEKHDPKEKIKVKPKLKYSITYPEKWKITNPKGVLSMAVSPKKLDYPWMGAINVALSISADNTSPIEELRTAVSNMADKVEKEETIILDNYSAFKFTFTKDRDGQKMRQQLYGVPVNEFVFIISTAALAEDFHKFEKDFDTSIQSFRSWFKISNSVDRKYYKFTYPPSDDIRSDFDGKDTSAFYASKSLSVNGNILILEFKKGTTLKSAAADVIAQLYAKVKDVQILRSGNRILQTGQKVFEVQYSFQNNKVRVHQIFALVRGKAVLVTFGGPIEEMKDMQTEINLSLESFIIK